MINIMTGFAQKVNYNDFITDWYHFDNSSDERNMTPFSQILCCARYVHPSWKDCITAQRICKYLSYSFTIFFSQNGTLPFTHTPYIPYNYSDDFLMNVQVILFIGTNIRHCTQRIWYSPMVNATSALSGQVFPRERYCTLWPESHYSIPVTP